MSSHPSQLGNIILRAGAGAGKTTTLTHLFLNYAADFKEQHKRFPRIVVTTFTRKATQELKERLLLLALEKQRDDLFQYITNKSQVQISTIHGVLSLFLGRYGHHIGLSSDFKLLNVSQEVLMRRKILRHLILSNASYESLLETYSFAQLESSLQAYYENSFLHPHFDFIKTADFAAELSEVMVRLEKGRSQVAQQVLAEAKQASWVKYGEALLRLSLKNTQPVEQILKVLEAFFEENNRKPTWSAKSPAVTEDVDLQLKAWIKEAKDLLDSPEFLPDYWQEHERVNEIFSGLAKEYVAGLLKVKFNTGSITMADLELLSLKLIQESPEACENFAAEWDYWMIDEYQDTSPIQVALLKALVGDRKSFIVGDPQQSIYLFRGARSEVFQEKMNQMRAAGEEVQEKLINYRSTPRLLHFINHYFLKVGGQFAAMEPAPDKTLTEVTVPVAQLRKVEKLENLTGFSEETKAALQRIQELLKQNISAEKICVLSRTRGALEDLAKAADVYGVPVQMHVAGGFYQRREVQDALALLKFLLNPHDNLNFLECLRAPWFHLSDQEILNYCHSYSHSFWSQAAKQVSEKETQHPVSRLRGYLNEAQDFGYSFVLRKILIHSGLLDFAQKQDPTGRREANLWKLVSSLYEQERTPGFHFLDFLAGLDESIDLEGGGEDSDATPVIAPQRVNLMTIHASKGLQFDQVILVGMTRKPRLSNAELFSVDETTGQWSLSLINEDERKVQASRLAVRVRLKFNQRELEEHLRVLYVALTRAKLGLTLVWSGKTEKNSWAESCPLLVSAGLQQESEFAYEVLEGSFEPEIHGREELQTRQDPGPWKVEKNELHHETLAVTAMIASEMQTSARSSKAPVHVQKALAKAYRGTEAHRIFESLKYTEADVVMATIEEPDLREAVRFVVDTQEIPLLDIIQQGHAEWGFAFKENEIWLQGQIDLWGKVGDEVWVVDYKTGSSEYSESAFQQLKAYSWALYKMKFIDPEAKVNLAVIYPFEEKIKVQRGIGFTEIQGM